MANRFGALEDPAQVAVPPGDPGLSVIGGFLRAALNARAQAAFTAGRLAEPGTPVVRSVFMNDPRKFVLDDCKLPALFVYRPRGAFEQRAADLLFDSPTFVVVWMLPNDRCRTSSDERQPFYNAIAKTAAAAIHRGIDPAWVRDGETDRLAAGVLADPDSIKLAVPTSTVAQSYSGAALDGVLAGTTHSPLLQPTVTTSAVGGTVFNTTEPVRWTVIDWLGRQRSLPARLTLPGGGETVGPPEDVARILGFDVPPQLAATGTLSFGTGGLPTRGTPLLPAGGFVSLRAAGSQALRIQAQELDASGRPSRESIYEGMELSLVGEELAASSPDHPAALDLEVFDEELP